MDHSVTLLRLCRGRLYVLVFFPLLLVAGSGPLAAQARPAHAAEGRESCPDEQRLDKGERGLDIKGLMRQHRIPGISIAVIHDFRLVCVKGYGVTAKDGSTPVTPTTLFLAGSISKPVAAVGALYLVQQGKLNLEDDVNSQLKSWKVPDSEHTRRSKVTLGLLLSHTGGFTGGDFFPGYGVDKPLPSLRQILDGVPPATNAPIRVGFEPGTQWRYSGDGYLVIQQLVTDVSGQRFPEFMRAAVFQKLGMNALSAQGKANHVLTQTIAREMITPHWKDGVVNILGTKQDPDQMGLGFFVGTRKGRFGHIGGNVGYQATMVMFSDTGDGVVVMTNSDVGLAAGNVLLDRIAEVYGWDYVAPPPP